ncbi:acyl carrier protein [Sporosarcina sp. FSL K6-3457]|uniref:acyl carrier protein n=1 Tax=Sporosarcina sp. FSL K6-3457 TaxID=2978204 RepID=UPI0030F78775
MNINKLKSVFIEALGIDESLVVDELAYNSIAEWDSIAHMALVAEIDDQFDIMLDTDDVLDMSSFAKAKEILAKYEISFD